ncbi:MAG: sigma-54-dependent Fis family transcriptional regulator [Sedimentisphaerales bacterium]|nr:sigma-54-dependent Fis family transcriptional regulator [Sedimentisphaerales bacterium]
MKTDSRQEKIRIIAVDNSSDLAARLRTLFKDNSADVHLEPSIDRVLEKFESSPYDILIVTSASFEQDRTDGLQMLEVITANSPMTQILFLVEPGDIGTAMSALKAGTYQYAKLPISDKELKLLIMTALEKRPVYGTNLFLETKRRTVRFEEFIGQSEVMQTVYRQIRQAAATDIPILLMGETGTGKDLAAQAIHKQSERNNGPYVAVNLGALPSELVGSELFGHEKGAFTGALTRREGKFEEARDGTIFLDEISTVDQKVQVSLLRLIEHKKFHRLGGKTTISTDARLVAASNQNLPNLVQQGIFRKDLYYRLDVFRIVMPPLRERGGDIVLLIDEFLKRFNESFQKSILGIAPECISLLEVYDWPGNVRELKNVIQRSVLVCEGEVLLPSHLPPRFRPGKRIPTKVTFELGTPLNEVEREMVVRALAATDNNRKQAADLLGISRRALYNKLRRHNIK